MPGFTPRSIERIDRTVIDVERRRRNEGPPRARWHGVPDAGSLRLVQLQPDSDKRYATVNAQGVFDGKTVSFPAGQTGDLREGQWTAIEPCWVLPLRHRPESLTVATYSSISGTFTAGEKVEQEGTGATGWLYQDTGSALEIQTEEGSAAFGVGGATDRTIIGQSSAAEAEMDSGAGATVSVDQESLDEEKVTLRPGWDIWLGRLLGRLDVAGDDRKLYAIDEQPGLRIFELVGDLLQNSDETWPIRVRAQFTDEPGEPEFWLYRPGELDSEQKSAYYTGVGRAAVTGHQGSIGIARWAPSRKRWEWAEGCFKLYGIGETQEEIPAATRGQVKLWWKILGADPVDVEASTMTVEALNWYYEKIESGDKVCIAFDRQENLWYIIDCERPVMVADDEASPYVEPIGKLVFDTDAGQTDYTQAYPFQLTQISAGQVKVQQLGPPELQVQESDGSPTVAPCRVLKFDANDFVVTDNGDGSATVSLRP